MVLIKRFLSLVTNSSYYSRILHELSARYEKLRTGENQQHSTHSSWYFYLGGVCESRSEPFLRRSAHHQTWGHTHPKPTKKNERGESDLGWYLCSASVIICSVGGGLEWGRRTNAKLAKRKRLIYLLFSKGEPSETGKEGGRKNRTRLNRHFCVFFFSFSLADSCCRFYYNSPLRKGGRRRGGGRPQFC